MFKFCRPKCHKAFQKKRNPRKIRWTKAFRKSAGKEMKVDASFEFEKKRNIPVRYDRELMGATIGAMKRVAAIQEKRGIRFYQERVKEKEKVQRVQRKIEIAKSVDLIAPAAARAGKEKNALVSAAARVQTKKTDTAMSIEPAAAGSGRR